MKGKKIILALLMILIAASLFAATEGEEATAKEAGSVLKYFAAALAVGFACICGGHAVGKSVQPQWALWLKIRNFREKHFRS